MSQRTGMTGQDAPRPRGRPRSFDRDVVLRRAAEVFWAQGYHSASIEELTSATGIKRSSLYHEFGDKETLFLAALDHYVEELVAPCLESLNSGQSLACDLAGFYDSILKVTCGDEGPKGCLVATVLAETSEYFRARLAACLESLDGVFQRRLEQAMLAGELSCNSDTSCLAKLFVSLSQGLTIRARSGESRESLRAIAGEAILRLLPAAR